MYFLFHLCFIIQNTLPMRHKEICAIKVHGSIKFAADFALGLITEKLRSRIKFHTTLESASAAIDVSLLPLEYGGTMPMAEMIGIVINIKINIHKSLIFSVIQWN